MPKSKEVKEVDAEMLSKVKKTTRTSKKKAPGTSPTGAPPTVSSLKVEKLVVGEPGDQKAENARHNLKAARLVVQQSQENDNINVIAANEKAVVTAVQEKKGPPKKQTLFSDLPEEEQMKRLFQTFPIDEVGRVIGSEDPRNPHLSLKPTVTPKKS